MPEILTDRLRLRPFEHDDPAFVAIAAIPRSRAITRGTRRTRSRTRRRSWLPRTISCSGAPGEWVQLAAYSSGLARLTFTAPRPRNPQPGPIQPATTRSRTGCNAPSKPLIRASEPSDHAVKPDSSPCPRRGSSAWSKGPAARQRGSEGCVAPGQNQDCPPRRPHGEPRLPRSTVILTAAKAALARAMCGSDDRAREAPARTPWGVGLSRRPMRGRTTTSPHCSASEPVTLKPTSWLVVDAVVGLLVAPEG
jgi:hypothetical protein